MTGCVYGKSVYSILTSDLLGAVWDVPRCAICVVVEQMLCVGEKESKDL